MALLFFAMEEMGQRKHSPAYTMVATREETLVTAHSGSLYDGTNMDITSTSRICLAIDARIAVVPGICVMEDISKTVLFVTAV